MVLLFHLVAAFLLVFSVQARGINCASFLEFLLDRERIDITDYRYELERLSERIRRVDKANERGVYSRIVALVAGLRSAAWEINNSYYEGYLVPGVIRWATTISELDHAIQILSNATAVEKEFFMARNAYFTRAFDRRYDEIAPIHDRDHQARVFARVLTAREFDSAMKLDRLLIYDRKTGNLTAPSLSSEMLEPYENVGIRVARHPIDNLIFNNGRAQPQKWFNEMRDSEIWAARELSHRDANLEFLAMGKGIRHFMPLLPMRYLKDLTGEVSYAFDLHPPIPDFLAIRKKASRYEICLYEVKWHHQLTDATTFIPALVQLREGLKNLNGLYENRAVGDVQILVRENSVMQATDFRLSEPIDGSGKIFHLYDDKGLASVSIRGRRVPVEVNFMLQQSMQTLP